MSRSSKSASEPSDLLFMFGAVLLIGLGAWLWLTGQIAALLFGQTWIPTGIQDLPGIAFALPGSIGDPAQAWPEAVQGHLPGLFGFIVAAVIAVALVTGACVALARILPWFTGGGRNGMASAADIDRKLSEAAALRKAKRLRPNLEGKAEIEHVAVSLGRAVGTRKRIVVDIENSVKVLAAPRQGKSSQVIIPWLTNWRGPALSTSIRPDVIEATYTIRERMGPVAVLDASGRAWPTPMKWSPVIGCDDYDKARRRAEVMIGAGRDESGGSSNAAFFRVNAVNLLAGWLHAAALDQRGIDQVARWSQNDTDRESMLILKRATRAAQGVEAHLDNLYSLVPETRGPLFATVQVALAPLLSERAKSIFCPTASEHLDLPKFLRESGTIYMLAPETDTAAWAPLLSSLVDDSTEAAMKAANLSPTGRLDPPYGMFIDEPANTAKLEHLPDLMSYSAGSGIFIVTIFQQFAAIRDGWGDRKAEAMWGNATVKIALGGLAAEDAQRFANEAGKYWEDVSNTTYGPAGATHSSTRELRDTMLASEVRQLDPDRGEALVIAGSAKPVKTRLQRHYQSKDRHLHDESKQFVRQQSGVGPAVKESRDETRPWWRKWA